RLALQRLTVRRQCRLGPPSLGALPGLCRRRLQPLAPRLAETVLKGADGPLADLPAQQAGADAGCLFHRGHAAGAAVSEVRFEQREMNPDPGRQREALVREVLGAGRLGRAVVIDQDEAVRAEQVEQPLQALDRAEVVQDGALAVAAEEGK